MGELMLLYRDDRYLIGIYKDGARHNLLVNDAYALLDKGVLDKLARANVGALESTLQQVGKNILEEMREKKIPLEELGWALAKAVIEDNDSFFDDCG